MGDQERDRHFWIIVASRDHAHRGIEASVIQSNHGKRAALDRMRPGDRVVIYSPKETFGEPGRLQAFTALGTVADGPVLQEEIEPGFAPFRRRVHWQPVHDAPLAPLLDRLDFIRNKRAYGAVFRFGVVRIPAADFSVIEKALVEFQGPAVASHRGRTTEISPRSESSSDTRT
jgi:hypothetical protein